MALTSKFSYQRLKHEDEIYDEVGGREAFARPVSVLTDPHLHTRTTIDRKVIYDFVRRTRWSRLRKTRIKIKRVKIRIPWLLRRKARGFVSSLDRVLKRLKESQAHFGDIFGGNYLFVQVNPTPYKLKQLQSSPSFRY